uniref:EGF-like domain-containing protein n=1 Tax=Megaselia scalaris TaxID=36166 RepID=T1GEP2_MEGSC
MYQDSIQPRPQFKLNGPKVEEGCVLCFQEDCQNGGKCTNSSEQYACTCMPGFEGDDCSTDIDECLTAQCTNNSTCIDEIAGSHAILCEHEIDECESNPCQNGGICTDLRAAYKCDCAEEYAGPQCDVLKLVNCDSDPNPCKKGSCVDGYNATTGNNFTCNCMTGYQGPMCDVPFCFIEECKNGGLCLNSKPLQPPICQCSIGYEGEYCEIDINECEPNPCQNGGQCIDEVGAYKCNCTGTGFEGPQCENDIDECNIGRTKCGGKGACINLPGSFKCECALGLCGYDCHLDDPCIMKESGVCDNGGSCVEKCTDVVDYTCNCTIGFMGKTCNQMARKQRKEELH